MTFMRTKFSKQNDQSDNAQNSDEDNHEHTAALISQSGLGCQSEAGSQQSKYF